MLRQEILCCEGSVYQCSALSQNFHLEQINNYNKNGTNQVNKIHFSNPRLLRVETSDVQSLQYQKKMNNTLEENFKQVIQNFYLTATKNHHTKYTLKNRFKKFVTSTVKQWSNIEEPPSPKLKIRSAHSIQPQKEASMESTSLRLTNSKRENQNNLSVIKAKSKKSRSKGSSREISQSDGSMFNCEWIYQSQFCSHTLLFGLMSALILTDNKVAFKYFEEKVNDQLVEEHFSELQLSTISHNWQRIGDLLVQSKSIRWRKILKEAIDKFPVKFSNFTCRYILSLDDKKQLMSQEVLQIMSRELKITIYFFSVNFRQIELTLRHGNYPKQIVIGQLNHSDNYVISTKMPEYSKEQLQMRAIQSSFQDILSTLVSKYEQNTGYLQFSDLMQSNAEKEEAVREHFRSKLQS